MVAVALVGGLIVTNRHAVIAQVCDMDSWCADILDKLVNTESVCIDSCNVKADCKDAFDVDTCISRCEIRCNTGYISILKKCTNEGVTIDPNPCQ